MKISQGTRQNWQRLNTDVRTRLQKRANKSRSEKIIFPLEYMTSPDTPAFIRQVVQLCFSNKIPVEDVIFSLALKLLEKKNILSLPHVREVLNGTGYSASSVILELTLPEGETDLPGAVYQCLQNEGKKNRTGSYYTPPALVKSMLSDTDLSGGRSFCDPCCGSGAFLLAAPAETPEQLWGCDRDPLAVFIAKVNLLCRYNEQVFAPQIFCADYLTGSARSSKAKAFFTQKFDVIATNPPWGADKNRGKESFSLFFRKAVQQVREGGKVSFLLPESLLRIKTHAPLRRFILQYALEKIVLHAKSFTGVMTPCIELSLRKAPPEDSFLLQRDGKKEIFPLSCLHNTQECSFLFISREDREILTFVQNRKNYFLKSSQFALGIVTGDNKNKVREKREEGMEPVYTGKDIFPYTLKAPSKYLRYVREELQQTAPDTFYRAPEKLVYRFISDKLVFACDSTGALFLNSANILIPEIPGMSIKTVLAFLNSRFMNYYYSLISGDLKILKSSLMQLPFPQITPEEDHAISLLTDRISAEGGRADEKLQSLIYSCYHLSQEQTAVIERHFSEI